MSHPGGDRARSRDPRRDDHAEGSEARDSGFQTQPAVAATHDRRRERASDAHASSVERNASRSPRRRRHGRGACPARRRFGRRRRRIAQRAPDESRQGLLARARSYQARPSAVLRRRGARAAAARVGPRHGDETLSQRRCRRVLLHEANAVAAARVARDVLDRARVRQRDRLPDGAGHRLAAVGGESRLHRPQPMVRALRRRRPPRLSAFRSRSRARRDVRRRARDRVHRSRRARCARHAHVRQDDRIARPACLRSDRARADAARRVDVREGTRAGAGREAARRHHRRIQGRQAAARPRARRLQPECVGPHACVDLLAAPAADRDGFDAHHVGRARSRCVDRRVHDRERAGAHRATGRPVGAAQRRCGTLRAARVLQPAAATKRRRSARE